MFGKRRLAMALALGLALAMAVPGLAAPATQKVTYDTYGPRVDEIIMPIVKDTEAQLIAFRRGEVQILPGLTRPDDIETLQADPNTALNINLGFHMFYMAFNMRRDPLSAQVIRQAIAHVVDRDSIIRQLFRGYMLPLASFVPQSSPFHNPNVPTYAYNPERAKQLLDMAGYTVDKATGLRIDPATGQPLRKMTILTPTYEVAPTSAELGRIIAEAAQSIGLPVEAEPMDFPVMLDKIDRFDFDMYTLAWGLSRNPTYLYDFFHSSQDVEAGYNTPGIRMPQLDQALEELYYAPDLQSAKAASDRAQMILSQQLPYIPLYSRPYIDAFRSDQVAGWVPMLGFGAADYANKWTMLNIHPVDRPAGGTVRWLLPEEPTNLNPIVASSAYEWEVLGRIVDGLLEMDPETLEYIPWLAKEWTVGTWEPEPGKQGTMVTFKLVQDAKWQDGKPFTSADVKFSLDYIRNNKVPLYLGDTQDITKVEAPDPYTVIVYFNNVSYWHLSHAITPPILPKHIWEGVTDWQNFQPWLEPHPEVAGMTKLVGLGPFMLKEYVPGEYVRLVKNPTYFRSLDRK